VSNKKQKMSSRQKYEGYATYSNYNGGNPSQPAQAQSQPPPSQQPQQPQQPPQQPLSQPVNERFSNVPPQLNQTDHQYPSSMIRTVNQGPSLNYGEANPQQGQSQMGMQAPPPYPPQVQPPPQQYPQQQPQMGMQAPPQQQEMPHRVRLIDADKMCELLSNSAHFFTQNKQPLRLFIKVSTNWCKPCIKIKPEIHNLSMNPAYANILFLEVDGDELTKHAQLPTKLRVSAVPSFFGFIAGQQVGFVAGTNMDEINGLCNKIARM
jgi:thiol-disulfide isomerase/thioredoxin